MTPAAFWSAAAATAVAILSLDLLLPAGFAGGVPYVLLVLLALKTPSRNTALGLAAAGSVLTALGFLFSDPGAALWVDLTNRAIALLAIWISVLPALRYQRVRYRGVAGRLDVEDIMNSVLEAIVISDERGIILAVNKSARTMFGYKAKELVGQSVAILRPEPERTRHQERIDEFGRTGRKEYVDKGVHQEHGLRKDGSTFPMELQVGELWRNEQRLFVGTARDVSARESAENALHESEDRFAKAFQAAPLMMGILRVRDFKYLDVNDAWLAGLGYERDGAVGRTSAEFSLWADESERAEAQKAIRETGSVRGLVAKWRRANGEIIDVRMQSVLLDVDGEPAILSIARDITEEKRAREALRKSEARFRDVAEISSDWIWETDANNQISYVSERIRDTLGFAPEIVIGTVRGSDDRLVNRGSKAWRHHLEDVEARLPFKDFIYQNYDLGGNIRYIQISGKPVFGDDGEFVGYRGVGADITERSKVELAKGRAEQERKQAHQHLQAIMDNVLEGIVTIDERGSIESINPAGAKLFGYAAGDVIGQNVSVLMSTGHGRAHDGYLATYIRTGERRVLGNPRELVARRRDGSEFPIELRVSEMHIGDSRTFVGTIGDLTERKNAEEALRRSEEHLRTVIENSSDVISIIDADGVIRSESPALERMSGFSRDELMNREVSTLVHPDDREHLLAVLSDVAATPDGMETVEYRVSHKDGTWLTMESIAKNMLDNPVVKGVVVTSRDISERRRAQDSLMAAKEEAEYANRSKTEFLANMSHELRTPLNAVIGFAGMIGQEIYGPLGSPKYLESAAHIDESATHLLGLINDLLDVSKIEVGKMDIFEEDFDVGPTIEQILRMIEPRAIEAGVTVSSADSGEPPGLRADKRMLKQMILNLVSNAVNFTPQGGSVIVGAEVDSGGALAISVCDTGIGMAEEDIPTALAAFGQIRSGTQPRDKGTGLGLPLTKSLIELHDGEIEITSTVGVGTTVTIRYPASRVRQNAASAEILQGTSS